MNAIKDSRVNILALILCAITAIALWEVLQGVVAIAGEQSRPDVLNGVHYTCYRIEGEAPPERVVMIHNQFEDKKIKVFSRELLCAPTLKEPLHIERPKPEG